MSSTNRARGARPNPVPILFILVFVTYGYFYQSGQDNGNARISQVSAIVERGRLDVPGTNSADVVRYEDRLYPNKAPGTSFVGVPSWWLFSQVFRAFDLPEALERNLIFHLTVWTTIGLATALMTLLLYRLLEHVLKSPALALLLSLAYAIGTIAFPYSTVFFSHQLAAALVFTSFGLLFLYKEHQAGSLRVAVFSSRFGSSFMVTLAGFLSGYALATEYPSALAVAPIGLYALRVLPWKQRLGFFIAGGVLGGGVLVLYNLLAFGQVYMIPYSVYAGTGKFDDHEIGYMGVGLPSLDVLMKITFLPMRGLFVVNPWLALVIPALLVPLFSARHREPYRMEKIVCAAIVVMFFAFNSAYGESYVFWGGGASVGPRHIIPMLPFAVFLLAPLLENRFVRYFFYASGLVSVAIMLMATATEPRVPYAYRNPVVDLFWDSYVRGRLALHFDGPFSSLLTTENSVAFNLGKLFGLAPSFQLLPLFAFWFAMVFKLSAITRWRSDAPRPLEAGGVGAVDRPTDTTAPVGSWSRAPVLVGGAFIAILFAFPFLFGNLEVRAGEEGNGLKATYAQGVLWEEPEEVYAPVFVPPEEVLLRRVEENLLFPWHHGEPPLNGSFSAEWKGWIYIPQDGNYKFATQSDDGSSVYIDGALVLENWGKHGRRRRHKDIRLKKGLHRVAVRYYNLEYNASMYFLWARPGHHLQSVAREYLFPNRPVTTVPQKPHTSPESGRG